MLQRRVRTAVIPAAGFGTRMMPATRAVPKELLPVGRKPAIEWVIEEAKDAGIERFVVVSSPRKPAIDDYLLGGYEPCSSNSPTLSRPSSKNSNRGTIQILHQSVARGLGDAVRLAHSVLEGEPFALLLPDELLLGGSRLLSAMLEDYGRTGRSSISLLEVPGLEIRAYGCARIASPVFNEDRLLVTGCVEKPDPYAAPSRFAISGRYVLGRDVLDLLKDVGPDGRGEIQITPALNMAAQENGITGFVVHEEDKRIDVGNWDGWLKANEQAFETERTFADTVQGHG